MHFKRYLVDIGDGNKIDISRGGISPYLGDKDSIITRNNVSVKTNDGIPGSGIYTTSKGDIRISPTLLFAIAAIFFTGFNMLTLLAVHVDYSFDKLKDHFFTVDNFIFILLFFAINSLAFVVLYVYKKRSVGRYEAYKKKIDWEIEKVKETKERVDGIKKDILSSYLNALLVEKEISDVEAACHAFSDYKKSQFHCQREKCLERFKELQRKLMDARYRIDAPLSEKESQNYYNICHVFELLATGSRIWNVVSADVKKMKHSDWRNVEFGTGIFDYIYSDFYPSLMKTADGTTIHIYSRFLLVARSSVDFDIIPFDSVHAEYVPIEKNRHYALMKIPELGLTFSSSSPKHLEYFVTEFEKYRKGLDVAFDYNHPDSLLEQVALFMILNRRVSTDMLKEHFHIGDNRTRRVFSQLESMGIISAETDGLRSINIWDIDVIRDIIGDHSVR